MTARDAAIRSAIHITARGVAIRIAIHITAKGVAIRIAIHMTTTVATTDSSIMEKKIRRLVAPKERLTPISWMR